MQLRTPLAANDLLANERHLGDTARVEEGLRDLSGKPPVLISSDERPVPRYTYAKDPCTRPSTTSSAPTKRRSTWSTSLTGLRRTVQALTIWPCSPKRRKKSPGRPVTSTSTPHTARTLALLTPWRRPPPWRSAAEIPASRARRAKAFSRSSAVLTPWASASTSPSGRSSSPSSQSLTANVHAS